MTMKPTVKTKRGKVVRERMALMELHLRDDRLYLDVTDLWSFFKRVSAFQWHNRKLTPSQRTKKRT